VPSRLLKVANNKLKRREGSGIQGTGLGDSGRGAGATGAVGVTAPVAQTLRGQDGGNRLPFYRNCNSKFVRYSQEFEFRTTVFLSNV
jgi:hypothetical protein